MANQFAITITAVDKATGVVRTVTAENGGKFAETWDGLDDNFMPTGPGRYLDPEAAAAGAAAVAAQGNKK